VSKKDYELIARVLRFRREHLPIGRADVADQIDILANMFATELAATNPRFNRERFLAACGVEQ
jgi:hypothetical protein